MHAQLTFLRGVRIILPHQVFGLMIILCMITFFLSVNAFAETSLSPLSPIEKKIRDEVIVSQAAQVALLKTLVNIDSSTTHLAGVNQVGEMLRGEFEKIGFITSWVNEPASMHRAGTLIAKHPGKAGPRLLLIGHLDTAIGGSIAHYTLHHHIAKGAGTIDDKGGVVVMLYALKALFAYHLLENKNIVVVLTGDEEDSGKPTAISRKPLLDVAHQSDLALDFEPSVSLNTATVARRGITNWTITSHGVEAHSATIFQKNVGDGAIFELARILTTMRLTLQNEADLSFNPGLILGGMQVDYDSAKAQGGALGKQNVIAKIALAKGDFRFISAKQEQAFKIHTSAIVKNHLAATFSTITFAEGIPAMPVTERNLQLLAKYSKASIDLGFGAIKPLPAGLRGAGDISHIAAYVSASLAGLGPLGDDAHSTAEGIELPSLLVQTQRAALFIYRLQNQ